MFLDAVKIGLFKRRSEDKNRYQPQQKNELSGICALAVAFL